MKDQILEFLQQQKGKKYDIKALSIALNYTSGEAYKNLAKAVNELEEETRIMPDEKNRYTLIELTDYRVGTLDIKAKGFGFLISLDDSFDDIYIAKQHLSSAMHKDKVLVKLEKSSRGSKKEGVVVKVLTRKTTTVVGTIIKRGKYYYIISDERYIKETITVKKQDLNGAEVHDKVQAVITSYAFKGMIEAKVIQVIGSMNEKGVDVLSKIFKHNVDPIFSKDVLNEAKKFQSIPQEDYEGRRDYQDRLIITIDGDDAKDYDDAIEVKKLSNGNYYLGVHIADVSHYVKPKSLLDKEAYKRGTSIYLVDRVIPMLPENLSNNLCSLMPDVERLALSCEIEIAPTGKIVHHEIFPSVIKSKARMTYSKVNHILEGDESLTHTYQNLVPMLKHAHELAKILQKKRAIKGSLNFETDEAYVGLNKEGKAISITKRTRGESEKIIEEFMLIANQVVAEHMHWLQLPFVYRIHEAPKDEKLERLLTMAEALGFDVKAKHEITHQEMQKLLKKVEDTTSEQGLTLMMLRAMQKAIYLEHNLGHFGLAFDYYTHFTSPIRRYPDLMVHRLLRTFIFNKDLSLKTIEHYTKTLPDITKHASERERLAISLERDVLDMKKAEYMADHIDETFAGTISSVTVFGLYVSLPNTVEGLVHISTLKDDYYHFNESLLCLEGEQTKRTFKIGDQVHIKVESVNVFEGEIDFILIKEAEHHENHRPK